MEAVRSTGVQFAPAESEYSAQGYGMMIAVHYDAYLGMWRTKKISLELSTHGSIDHHSTYYHPHDMIDGVSESQ